MTMWICLPIVLRFAATLQSPKKHLMILCSNRCKMASHIRHGNSYRLCSQRWTCWKRDFLHMDGRCQLTITGENQQSAQFVQSMRHTRKVGTIVQRWLLALAERRDREA